MTTVIRVKKKNREFLLKTEEISGEHITMCEQCGICTTSCPMAEDMDISPASIIHLVQIGDEGVLDSTAIWLCASCYTCTVRCPRGIDLAAITEALRQQTLRKSIDYIDINGIDRKELEELPAIALVSALRKYTS